MGPPHRLAFVLIIQVSRSAQCRARVPSRLCARNPRFTLMRLLSFLSFPFSPIYHEEELLIRVVAESLPL